MQHHIPSIWQQNESVAPTWDGRAAVSVSVQRAADVMKEAKKAAVSVPRGQQSQSLWEAKKAAVPVSVKEAKKAEVSLSVRAADIVQKEV